MVNIKNKLSYLTLLCVVFLTRALSAQEASLESLVIEKISIIVAPDGSESAALSVKAKLKSREGAIFSQTAFDEDLKLLSQEYDRVEPKVEPINGKIVITLRLWQKPKISTIHWQGNEKIKTRRLESELGIKSGAVFDRTAFSQAFQKVKTYYIKKGFFEAELDYTVNYDEVSNTVAITVTIVEGRAGKIQKIVFCNFTKAEQRELLEMMVTKRYNFFLSWLNGTGIYNEDMIQHDKLIVLNYLQNKGFADATVDIDVEEARQKDRIIVTIGTTRGARYYFGDVSMEGNTLFPTEELLKCIKICPGEPYSPELIHQSTEILTNHYGRLGYIETIINHEPSLSENSCRYDVKITIEEGEKYHVGMIKVLGNSVTQTKVILHEVLLVPGEVFNLEKLKITEARLCNVGYFKHVNVYAVKSEKGSVLPGNYRDVHIEVEETNTGFANASIGFSTGEDLVGGISITENNFNGRGLTKFWSEGFRALRGGGEHLNIGLTAGSRSRSYSLSWTKPHFNDTPWTVGFDLEKKYNKYISDDYEINSYGLILHAKYNVNQYVRVGTHYRIKYSDVKIDKDKCKDEEENKELHKDCHNCKERERLAREGGLISALGFNWTYDSTDSFLCPTRGLRSRFEGEVVGVGGDRAFLSFGYLNAYYVSLPKNSVLKFRADCRFIQPLGSTGPDNIPLDERFFLGGDNDVRGYRPYALGPRLCKEKDSPRGGISQQLFSVEYNKPLFSCVDGFLFFDSGSLTMRRWQVGRFYHSLGFGTRVKVFQGTPPITLGMGFPLNPKRKSDVKRFFINIGARF